MLELNWAPMVGATVIQKGWIDPDPAPATAGAARAAGEQITKNGA